MTGTGLVLISRPSFQRDRWCYESTSDDGGTDANGGDEDKDVDLNLDKSWCRLQVTTEEEPAVTEHDREDIGAHRLATVINQTQQ